MSGDFFYVTYPNGKPGRAYRGKEPLVCAGCQETMEEGELHTRHVAYKPDASGWLYNQRQQANYCAACFPFIVEGKWYMTCKGKQEFSLWG